MKKPEQLLIQPGPWTTLKSKVKVRAYLKPIVSISFSLGKYWGVYRSIEGWEEPGTYPVVFNLTANNLSKLVLKHDLNQVIAACEKSLSAVKDGNGRSRYGRIVILEVLANRSKNQNKQFISCVAKTTKKRIRGFLIIRKGVLAII